MEKIGKLEMAKLLVNPQIWRPFQVKLIIKMRCLGQ
jgi:hypothetical protein